MQIVNGRYSSIYGTPARKRLHRNIQDYIHINGLCVCQVRKRGDRLKVAWNAQCSKMIITQFFESINPERKHFQYICRRMTSLRCIALKTLLAYWKLFRMSGSSFK